MSQQGMRVFFIFVTVVSCTVHASLQITTDDYPLMHYTSLISEENFIPGRPLVIMLPLAAEGSTGNEVKYLIQELHTSGHWPILVFNFSNELNRSMYTEIYQHYSYIILRAGSCKEWEQNTFDFQKQLSALSGGELRESWNPNAKFVIPVMANCTHFDCKNISRSILSHLWTYPVSNAIVLFLKPNAHGSNDLQQNTSDLAKGTYLEIHTWYPYENSERCNPADGNVPVRVFRIRNLSDVRKNDIFKRVYDKNFHKCSISVRVTTAPPFVNEPKRVLNDDTGYQDVYDGGWEIEMLKIMGNSLNISLDIESDDKGEYRTSPPVVYVGGYEILPSSRNSVLTESSRNYLTIHSAWYTPCALKYQKWSRFFNIFSVDLWICFSLSLVLTVITVKCISNYGNNSHLHESISYSNISSVTVNIIAVVLSVSVNTQPRSAPLRLFFFCWVCYSVAISTVFQAYFTTFLIEPGYLEPIKTVEQMLKSEKKFGFFDTYEIYFTDTSDSVDSRILKNAVRCPTYGNCLKGLIDYHNISTILSDLTKTILDAAGNWKDENNRPLLCKLEYGDVHSSGLAFLVSQGSPLLEFINDLISHIDEGGIFMQIRNRGLYKAKLESTFADTHTAISIRHLQTVFYLLLLGYVFSLACLVGEIMWHRYRSRGRRTSVTDGHK